MISFQTCAIADLGLCVRHIPDGDQVLECYRLLNNILLFSSVTRLGNF